MNPAQLHLTINHLPLVGLLIGFLVLATGLLVANNSVKKTALGILLFSLCATVGTNLTGEGAEETIDNLNLATHDTIQAHKNAAGIFARMMYGVGLLSLLVTVAEIKQDLRKGWGYILLLILCIATLWAAYDAGHSGGSIRHTEMNAYTVAEETNQRD